MQAYIATEGTYPIVAGSACITAESGCHDSSGVISMRATFDTNMTVVGQLPRSIPSPHGERRGIFATYWSGATEGPVFLTYFLQGTSQQCGLSGVLNANMNGYAALGYTSTGSVNGMGVTMCAIKVPGPPHAG